MEGGQALLEMSILAKLKELGSPLPSLSDEIGGWILKTKMLLSPFSVFLKCFTGLSKTESRRRWLQQKTCKLEVEWGERRLGPEETQKLPLSSPAETQLFSQLISEQGICTEFSKTIKYNKIIKIN